MLNPDLTAAVAGRGNNKLLAGAERVLGLLIMFLITVTKYITMR